MAQLQAYTSVLVYSDGAFQNTTLLGDNLAAYIDGGGGVVTAAFATGDFLGPNYLIGGAFATSTYQVVVPAGHLLGTPQTLGTVHLPAHPLMASVTNFDNGSSSFHSTATTLTPGGYRVADLSDGSFLIAAKDNVGLANVKRVDIGFYPPSSDSRGDFWVASTDGATILKNALLYVSQSATSTPTVSAIAPICNGASAKLTATCTGSTVKWYDATGTNLLATGSPFITPNLATNTTYKVRCESAGCNSAFVPVNVTINPLPTASISGTTTVSQNSTAPKITFTGANGTAPYTFTYKIGSGANQTVTTTTGNSVTVDAPTGIAGSFVYTLIGVQDASTCSQLQTGAATITVTATRISYVVCPDAKILNFEDLVTGIVPTTTATTNNGIATSITSTDKIFELPCGSTTRPEGFPFDAFFNPMSATGVGSIVVRTFTANFGSGISSTCSQVFYIKLPDSNTAQAPVATTALCQNGVPNTNPNSTGYPRFSNGNVISEFTQGLMATFTDAPILGGILVRTWTVKNKCGASKTFIQNITIPTCVAPQIAISGNIKRETGEIVAATVKIFNTRDSINKAEGSFYNFPSLPMGESYRIRPERTYDVLNGVSTFDINVIAKYLLGIETAKSPYQLIAMDVNRNGEVEAGDMLLIRNLILRKIDNFPNNTAWRFIPKSYVFKNPNNPFAEDFPEILSLTNPTQNVTDADFVAVKVGDGNLSARTSNLSALQVRNTPEIDYLQLPDMLLEQGKTYQIPVKINAKALVALQFALTIDKKAVESFSIENGDLAQFGEGNYNVLQGNTVATAWASSKSASDNTIFTLVVKAKKQVSVKELVSLNNGFSDNLGYNTEGSEKHLQLQFSSVTSDSYGKKQDKPQFDLLQNRPNPFTNETTISFILPETNNAELSIFDITGRQVYTLKRDFSKGYNEVILNKSVLKNTGVYFYRLQSDKFVAVKKMQYFAE